jgi:Fe-S-cluster-containing dehydrogenase component
MAVTRRELLATLVKTGVPAAVAATVTTPLPARAETVPSVPNAAVALLYDATRCIGCKACVSACAEANGTPPDTRGDNLHQAPSDLNDLTRNIVKLYKSENGSETSFVKRQCMHCLDPACAAGCPFQALHKDPESGIVSWDAAKCIGCRYCTITCPYHVPRFQWQGFNPRVTKCEFCRERLDRGLKPACTTVCPTKAVMFGPRPVLLMEAKRRIAEHPGKYYGNRVYGEKDNGGTQALYLSHVAFAKIGLPELGVESVPSRTLRWQKRIYQYMVLPSALYVAMVHVIRKSFKEHAHEAREEEKKTGLRAQL